MPCFSLPSCCAWPVLAACCAIFVAACGGSSVTPPATHLCLQELPGLWGSHASVGEGAATLIEEGDAGVLHVDASAGGMAASRTTAFVFVDLAHGQLALSESEALTSGRWHLAFKRAQLRVNGGTSGAGNVSITRLHGVPFETVSQADIVDVDWHIDHSFAADCTVRRDPIGQPMTAIHDVNLDNPSGSSSWYHYGPDGVVPMPDTVYVVRDGDGTAWALTIDDWQDGQWTLRVRSL